MLNKIVIILLLITLIIITLSRRKTKLNELVFERDEIITNEFDNIAKVESICVGSEMTVFKNCKIIITNKRTIIAQEIALPKSYRVKYIISKDFSNKISMKTGIITFAFNQVKMEVGVEQNSAYLLILPVDSSFFIREIKIFSNRHKEILQFLNAWH